MKHERKKKYRRKKKRKNKKHDYNVIFYLNNYRQNKLRPMHYLGVALCEHQ